MNGLPADDADERIEMPDEHTVNYVFPVEVVDGGAPTGTAQFILDGGEVGNPVTLDSNGRALWSTSALQVGQHQIVTEYIPTGWGGLFMASASPKESHTVIAADYLYFWLIILLLIIILTLIVFIIWRYRRTT